MTATKLKRGTFQHIESELYAYYDTCKEIEIMKNEIIHGKGYEDENVGGGRSGFISDPTGRTAVLLISHKKLEQLQNISNAISSVYELLPPEKKRMIKLRYWTRSQTLTWEGVANEVPAHRATVIRWRNEVIYAIAEKLGWS